MRYLLILLVLLTGCTVIEVPAPKQFECTPAQSSEELTTWYCRSIATGKCIKNIHVGDNECIDLMLKEKPVE